jgi:asparagine synthetase B (glutamine-hydrolysing)
MCGIIGSFSKEKLSELLDLNASRGQFSHSLTTIDPDTLECNPLQKFGKFDKDLLRHVRDGKYMLAHIQAPTGGLIHDQSRIHPATIKKYLLWHNGILKNKEIQRLNTKYSTNIQWDTKLLLHSISRSGIIPTLKELDGAFACVLIEEYKSFKIFRNQTSPLYIGDNLDISSVEFEGSKMLPMNYVYNSNFKDKCFERRKPFLNQNTPYFFTDDEKGVLNGELRRNT